LFVLVSFTSLAELGSMPAQALLNYLGKVFFLLHFGQFSRLVLEIRFRSDPYVVVGFAAGIFDPARLWVRADLY
jgi:hypothetical protein